MLKESISTKKVMNKDNNLYKNSKATVARNLNISKERHDESPLSTIQIAIHSLTLLLSAEPPPRVSERDPQYRRGGRERQIKQDRSIFHPAESRKLIIPKLSSIPSECFVFSLCPPYFLEPETARRSVPHLHKCYLSGFSHRRDGSRPVTGGEAGIASFTNREIDNGTSTSAVDRRRAAGGTRFFHCCRSAPLEKIANHRGRSIASDPQWRAACVMRAYVLRLNCRLKRNSDGLSVRDHLSEIIIFQVPPRR